MKIADEHRKDENRPEMRARSTLVTTAEVAEALEVDVSTVLRWAERDDGPKPRVSRPKLRLWDLAEVTGWARAKKKGKFRHAPKKRARTITAEHGTRLAYQQGCRKECCREANAAYHREYQARRRLDA